MEVPKDWTCLNETKDQGLFVGISTSLSTQADIAQYQKENWNTRQLNVGYTNILQNVQKIRLGFWSV